MRSKPWRTKTYRSEMNKDRELLLSYPHSNPTRKPNALLVPVTRFDIGFDGAKKFNEIFSIAKRIGKRIVRTPSGGISYKNRGCCSDWRRLSHCVEVTIIHIDGIWRFQFRSKAAVEKMSGRAAFSKFKSMLKEDGIILDDYAIDDGEKVKRTIEKPMIRLAKPEYAYLTFQAHHIDFHSSYPAGLANTHPEFRKTMERLYLKRDENDLYKAILNYSIGFMQSLAMCNAKWAHLSRDAIKDNNDRIFAMSKRLIAAGRRPLLFNTDGIWYEGDIYHGEGEGSGLGQWHNDHVNCKFRMKSAGAYEFIEDGVYNPVVRGIADTKKEGWSWGDIFSSEAEPKVFVFDEEMGIMSIDEKGERHEIKEVCKKKK